MLCEGRCVCVEGEEVKVLKPLRLHNVVQLLYAH